MFIILKIISIVLIPFMLLAVTPDANAQMDIPTSAKACVLMYEDGTCIYEKNADDKNLIASTTKIMTAIICLENAKLDEKVCIKQKHCLVEGSSMYLKAGEKYTVNELLIGLMLASGNDAALALAEHVAGGVDEFAELMNEKAKEIGMDNSSFSNPHGLDAKNHYSTARDMAKLMLYCMEDDSFRQIVSMKTAKIKDINYSNHNRLLTTYSGCIGGKTGFTAAAGRCLVSCCEKEGVRLVCVTLSAPDDWRDHKTLYDYAFNKWCLHDISGKAQYLVPVVSGSKKCVKLIAGNELKIYAPQNEKIELRAEIPTFVFAPVKKGQTAGKICVIIKGNVVAELGLVYAEDAVTAYAV